MSSGLDLEQRYRRVLRLLPGYYRDAWEEDMVAAFLDSWLTGDPETDELVLRFCRPSLPEVASVTGLAVRLYLGGADAPRRYFPWRQAVRGAVLAVALMHAVRGLGALVALAWADRLLGVPAPPATMAAAPLAGVWPTVWCSVGCAWIVVFVALVLGRYRAARLISALAIVPGLVAVLQAQRAGTLQAPVASWAFWVLLGLLPVLAMSAFHRDAPLAARWPWLAALPAGYLLVGLPLLAALATGDTAWLPDLPGLCCLLVALACLTHAPWAWSRRSAGSGAWSLTLTLLTAVAGVFRIVSLGDCLRDPHLIKVGLAELLILTAAVALVAPDAARTQIAVTSPPPYPRLG